MGIRIIIISSLLLLAGIARGQNYKQYIKAGDKAMEDKDFYAAMRYYQDALAITDSHADTHYKCADAARQFAAFATAERHYTRARELSEVEQFPLLPLYLGMVKQTLGNYAEANMLFEEYYNRGAGDERHLDRADMGMESCQWAVNQEPTPEVEVIRLSEHINSKFSEFAGRWLPGDSLLYASLQYEDKSVRKDRKIAKILLSTDPTEERGDIVSIKGTPKKDADNIANSSLNDKEQRIYFTVCEYENTVDLRCSIYEGIWNGRRWLAEELPAPVNLKGYTNTHPAWRDHGGVKGIYFSSDRPNGRGGMDIWFSEYQRGEFLEPVNIEKINTPFHEITPGYDNGAKGQDLYFSSDGYKGFGHYDVYVTHFRDSVWTTPENMGTPINSGYNDVYFWRDSEMERALVSSNRPEAQSMLEEEPACCNDLYNVIFPEKEEEIPEDLLVDKEPDPLTNPNPNPDPDPKPQTTIPQTNPQPRPIIEPMPKPQPITQPRRRTLDELLPVRVYFDNDEPDKRTRATRTIKSYTQSYNEYLNREYTFYEKYTEGLPAIHQSEALDKLVRFFNDDVRRGYSDLELLSYLVLEKLQAGKTVQVDVRGYTSPRAKTTYNDNLARRRTSSLINYFNSYQGGVFRSYLESNKMVIRELPIGEVTAPPGISDSLPDERNSIYSPEASLERRAEVVAVRVE